MNYEARLFVGVVVCWTIAGIAGAILFYLRGCHV
jgi:hypothetical protein